MSFKEHYFAEENKDTNMVPTFLERFKEDYLPNRQIKISQSQNQNEDAEWVPLSIEISDADTEADTEEQGSNIVVKKMSTDSFKFDARFGIRNMFAGDVSKYNPEQFYDRDLLMSMKADILRMLNDGNMMVLTENVMAPKGFDKKFDRDKAAAEGTYKVKFDDFYDIIEKKFGPTKRQKGYDKDVFVVVQGVARKS